MFRVTRIRLFAKAVAATWNNQRVTCDIEVQASKSITLSTTNVSVAPGENYYIDYTINPPSDSLDLSRSAETSAVIFTDQGHDDKGRGKIMVTGIKPGTAQIYAFTNPGGVYAKYAVTCEWDYRFKLTKESNRITKIPGPGKALRTDGTYEDAFTFSVTTKPEDAFIALSLSPYPLVASESELNGQPGVVYSVSEHADGSRHYKLWAPQNLTQDVTVYITAKNPRDNDKIFGQAQISGSFQYNKITPTLSFGTMNAPFGYSRFDAASGAIYVGDGEAITLNVGLKEDFVPDNQWSLESVTIRETVPATNPTAQAMAQKGFVISNTATVATNTNASKQIKISNNGSNVCEYSYHITQIRVPVVNLVKEKWTTYALNAGMYQDFVYEMEEKTSERLDLFSNNILSLREFSKCLTENHSSKNCEIIPNFAKIQSIVQNHLAFPGDYTWVTEEPKEESSSQQITNPFDHNLRRICFIELADYSWITNIPKEFQYLSEQEYKSYEWFFKPEHNWTYQSWGTKTGSAVEKDYWGINVYGDKQAFNPAIVGVEQYGQRTGELVVKIKYKNTYSEIVYPVYTTLHLNNNKKD